MERFINYFIKYKRKFKLCFKNFVILEFKIYIQNLDLNSKRKILYDQPLQT